MSDQQSTSYPADRWAAQAQREADGAARLEAGVARLRADHDRRVTELLEANNREVERRRLAEAELARLKAAVRIAVHDLRYAHYAEGYPMNLPRITRRLEAAIEETGTPQP